MEENKDQAHVGLLARVARMYFQEGLTQAEIARKTGYSRPTISRFLREARQERVVEIHIHEPVPRNTALEQALQERFNLKYLRVAKSQAQTEAQMLSTLGIQAAWQLDEWVVKGMVIGIGHGLALTTMVGSLTPRGLAGIHVVQLIAAPPGKGAQPDGAALAQRMARLYGGQASLLEAPARPALPGERAVDLALLGIGGLEPGHAGLVNSGCMEPEGLPALAQLGVVGDVCGICFRLDGSLVETHHDCITRLDAGRLQRIPVRLGIAGGAGKGLPCLGALHAGLVNALIVDESAARVMLNHS
ncbi:MAG: sugar-binding domain-containing protein [Anaerolineaceae bacterium]|jgi:deoxyribonucleoside regulator|nr:sugar-binding domain-containing protein [Anaerolineaceae bacterium]